MGIENYFLKYVKITYICRRRSEMVRTIENFKRNINVYNNYNCKNIIYHVNNDETKSILEEKKNEQNEYHVPIDNTIQHFMNLINVSLVYKNEIKKEGTNTTSVEEQMKYSKNIKEPNEYILKYKINHIIGKRGKREQYRYTYLKSPFKYKYALRHYVFERYKYHFYIYNITHFNINIIFNIILSSMTKDTSVNCNINWFYSGKRLFDSKFFRTLFGFLLKKQETNPLVLTQLQLELKNLEGLKEGITTVVPTEKKQRENTEPSYLVHSYNDGEMNDTNYSAMNLDLRKYNIQNLLPLFLENKIVNDKYKKMILMEEKSFKETQKKIRKKNLHWFVSKNPMV